MDLLHTISGALSLYGVEIHHSHNSRKWPLELENCWKLTYILAPLQVPSPCVGFSPSNNSWSSKGVHPATKQLTVLIPYESADTNLKEHNILRWNAQCFNHQSQICYEFASVQRAQGCNEYFCQTEHNEIPTSSIFTFSALKTRSWIPSSSWQLFRRRYVQLQQFSPPINLVLTFSSTCARTLLKIFGGAHRYP